ncbi:MAG: hypothetical protein ABSG93_18175 [Solirubrobacteraceae bacterium]|jgi:hypothetical protein
MSPLTDTTAPLRAIELGHRPAWLPDWLRNLALLVLAGGIVGLLVVSTASAGTYVIDNCPAAPGGNGNPGPWTVFGAPQNTKGSCDGGPGDFIGPLGGSMAPATVDGVQVAVPGGSGITITAARIWWFVPHQASGADTFADAGVNTGGIEEAGTPKDSASTPDEWTLPSNTTELTLADYCSNDDAGAGCTFGGGENPDLELLGSELTLDDTTLPSGTVTGGALASSGTVSGTASISYQAADASSGVRLVQLRVDGEPLAEKDYIASCSYTDFQACPPSVSDTISWNTATVAAGQHRVELVVEDAAQNTSVIYSGEVTVQNAASTASLGALPGPGSTGATVLGSGNPNGTRASEEANLRLGLRRTITRTYAHRALMVAGRLLDGQGQPIGHATLDVSQQLVGTAAPQLVTHTTTGSDGTFSVRVPAGPSRAIEIAYRAFSGDASYAAVANIAETVEAGVRLSITPTQTGPEGMIVLSGTVEGAIPQQGAIVDLLVHYRGRWEPFRTPRTNERGRFRVAYQFEGGVGRFPFRAEVPGGQAGFPFGSGDSQVVDVSTK